MYNPSGTLSYVLDPSGQFLEGLFSGGGTSAIPLGGRILAQYQSNGANFSHVNALGSETQNTDYAGNGALAILYYPWGEVWQNPSGDYPNNLYQIFGSLQLADTSTDGYVPPFRYYIPEQSRWLTPDPLAGDITNPQSLNRYAYALNNPTSIIDPLGLEPKDPCDRNPNSHLCSGFNDAFGSAPPGAGLFGLDYFDLALLGFLPGSGLPSGICPAQFQSCVVFANGVIVGIGSSGLTAFSFGSPCSARDEAGNCSLGGVNVLGTLAFSSLGNTVDSAYGTVLGFLGKFFKGRRPGQSFGACVNENVTMMTFGAVDPKKLFNSGLAKIEGAATFLSVASVPVSLPGGTYMAPIGPLAAGNFAHALGLSGSGAAYLVRAVTGGLQALAVAGAATLGAGIGSSANCATVGTGF